MGRERTGARIVLAVLAAFLFITPAAAAAADYAATGISAGSAASGSGAAEVTTGPTAAGSTAAGSTAAGSTVAGSTAAGATVTGPSPTASGSLATVGGSVATTTASSPSPTVTASASASVTLSARARYLAARARYLAVRRADRAATIVRIAKRYLWHPYVLGATGPWAFDCIGLVRFVYRKAGIGWLIGPWQNVQGTLLYFRDRHEASRHSPQVGDLVVYGHGSHIGIYIGHGRVISALIRGVRIHGVFDLTTPFTTYLHVNL